MGLVLQHGAFPDRTDASYRGPGDSAPRSSLFRARLGHRARVVNLESQTASINGTPPCADTTAEFSNLGSPVAARGTGLAARGPIAEQGLLAHRISPPVEQGGRGSANAPRASDGRSGVARGACRS